MRRLLARSIAVAVAAILVAGLSAASPVRRVGRTTPSVRARQRIRALRAQVLSAGGRTILSPGTGYLRFVSLPAGWPLAVTAHASAEGQARAFLAQYGEAFGLGAGGGEVLVERISARDQTGMEHVRMRQTVNGVPVTGGEMTLHLRNGGVVAALVRALPDLGGFDTMPRLAASDASAIAVRGVGRAHLGADATWSKPRLEILWRPLLGGAPFPPRLAWFLEARRIDLREYVWIDAQAGVVLLHFSQLADVKQREVYDAAGGFALPGTPVRSEGDPPTGDLDQDAAYEFTGDAYDYFASQHGRDSFDGAGATIVSSTDVCLTPCPWANARWNGSQLVFGAGFAAADDVVAHELAHAVTEHTANLFCYMQSGALNESLSDIFGETVDQLDGAGTDGPGVAWQIGEDLPGGAIRDMADPTAFGDPGKMSDPELLCENYASFGDQGGVHVNSGISNHAYELAVEGGTYNAQNVSGIGLAKADKVWYRALNEYLVSSSDFADLDAVLRQSCTDLIGTASISSADCAEVGKALEAVEMAAAWPCSPAQAAEPALCPAGQLPGAYLFTEDVEDAGKVTADWAISGTDGVWANQGFSLGPYASSGTHSFWGYDPWLDPSGSSLTADASLEMTRDILVASSDIYLSFAHSFGFEFDGINDYDGGRIESSSDAGANWSDGGGLIDAGAAYGGSIATGFGNPLAGASAFVAYSWGYTGSRLTLASMVGQSFRVRFRVAADGMYDDYGWFIDDVAVYRCFPDGLIFADGFEVGSAGQWSVATP